MTRPTTPDVRHSCAPWAHPDLKGAVCWGSEMPCSYLANYMKSEHSLFAISGRDQLPAPANPDAPGDNQGSANARNSLYTESGSGSKSKRGPRPLRQQDFSAGRAQRPVRLRKQRHVAIEFRRHRPHRRAGTGTSGSGARISPPSWLPIRTPDPPPYDRGTFTHLSYTHPTTICPLSR